MTLPTIVPTLEGLEFSAWAVSEELALVTVPMDGEVEGVFDGVVLELTEVLKELMGLTELVAVSGKTGSDDERNILDVVNGTDGIHMLLGWSDDSEVAAIGKSPIELERTEVVGIRVEVENSEMIVAVELTVDITVSRLVVDSSVVVVRATVTVLGFSVDESSTVAVVLESGPGPDMV
ncbi:hypothetical protein N7537_002541 [Penicillium hordei]|uniref:Uncharacterized protein n=1 Tax=Penicillium hordei TaxID=40994 RepID=A0AAD6EJB6_9EURO|nr:uncharacterized protein N7537_002541 [Penicillium hordei]KAJ5617427.1 hypothetical protein N7537_002541 [Penicillium hordei]